MEGKAKIAKAIIAVMQAVKGIDKSMTIGEGKFQYSGVSDQDVKEILRVEMMANGLVCLPIGIDAKTEVSRWTDAYNKEKQSVFTEVKTKYLLLHESGESIELEGYGHGVDPQDKGAGKATTYALKYALLYAFLIPTVKIDDADKQHSNDMEAPPNPIMIEVNAAIGKLKNVNNESEMKDFGSTLPAHIKTDMRFRQAATARQSEFMKPVQETAAA